MAKKRPDFQGFATRANIKCADGRTIMKNAFADDAGRSVPLVWNHQHNEPFNVLGHAILENRDGDMYCRGYFNDTESGITARKLVESGDINALSIYANNLIEKAGNVTHGIIREVSLVLAGANPGAFIDTVSLEHSSDGCEEAVIYTGEIFESVNIEHSDPEGECLEHSDKEDNMSKEKTVKDVVDSMTEEQKTVMYALIGAAMDEKDNEGGNTEVKHNVFDMDDEQPQQVLSHDAMKNILDDAKKHGSLKESFLAHAENYGITNIEYLFPEATSLNNPPDWIKRDTGWVGGVISGVHHTPFSRIKSQFADITEDDARAKGYIKGKYKKEEFFSLLKRTTEPTTIYKKQKLDKDDVTDITDFDVIPWIKGEMRLMLDEEIARAILVGDGRPADSDDKIREDKVRPIWKDDPLYTIKYKVNIADTATESEIAKEFIRSMVKARKNYKGSGNLTLYTTEDIVTDCLLLEDTTGRRLYNSESELATAMRVSKIVTVPVMENLTRESGADTMQLMGIAVNLSDYNVGADKGGAISMFDDFDIDYNQQKYLIETRISGALTKPYSAIALEIKKTA